jgi:hypothetical protein
MHTKQNRDRKKLILLLITVLFSSIQVLARDRYDINYSFLLTDTNYIIGAVYK